MKNVFLRGWVGWDCRSAGRGLPHPGWPVGFRRNPSNWLFYHIIINLHIRIEQLPILSEASHNTIYIDTINAPGLNVNATLTIFNLSYNFTPTAMKDNVICPDCSFISYNGNFTFNVTGFSTYSAAENSKISINVTNKVNNRLIPNQNIYFLVNYSNRTSGASINGSGAGCNISFNGTYYNMSFNSTSLLYEYNSSFADLNVRTYDQSYNVSCVGSSINYENINYSSSFEIYKNATLLTLGQSLDGVVYQASLVLADLNNDSLIDLLISGSNGTIITKIYNNNGSSLIYNQTLADYGISHGSIGVIDYDKDSDFDIMQTGEAASGDPTSRILKNS